MVSHEGPDKRLNFLKQSKLAWTIEHHTAGMIYMCDCLSLLYSSIVKSSSHLKPSPSFCVHVLWVLICTHNI